MLLKARRRTYLIASVSVFASVYSVLGLIPVSPYVGINSFLSFKEVISPLAGILFGPLGGGASMVLGTFIDFGLGRPVSFDFLDFVPDLASALTAGLCFTGRRKAAVALPASMIFLYFIDPLSLPFVNVGGVAVPFLWMHILSLCLLASALALEGRGKLSRLGVPFVAATIFASTMSGHVAGSLLYENIYVRVNHVFGPLQLRANWVAIFYLYPAERLFFTVAGTAVSVPVLRAIAWRKGARGA